jgi:hypothetical protein
VKTRQQLAIFLVANGWEPTALENDWRHPVLTYGAPSLTMEGALLMHSALRMQLRAANVKSASLKTRMWLSVEQQAKFFPSWSW